MRRMYSPAQIERLITVKSVNGKNGDVVLDATDIKTTTNKQTIQDNLIRIDHLIDHILPDIPPTGTWTLQCIEGAIQWVLTR